MRKLNDIIQLIFFLVAICHNGFIYSQKPDAYFYQYYNTAHGLPSPEITCLIKDGKGFLWLGTASGISMYDGYSFTNYNYTKDNEIIGHVNVIQPGPGNDLWVGTAAGLFYVSNSEVIKVSAASELPQGINDILTEDDGLWLATENGPAHLSIKDTDLSGKKKLQIVLQLLPQWKQKGVGIRLIKKAPDGSIFFSSQNELFKLQNSKLTSIYQSPVPRDIITSLFPVNKSKIYFDAVSSELCVFENDKVNVIGFKNFYKPDENTNPPGNWYIGTRGAFYFHPQTGTASRHISFSDNYFLWAKQLLEDGNFYWVASYNGLVKLKPSVFTTYPIKRINNDNDYYSFAALKNGKLLLGANHGNIYENKNGQFILYKQAVVPSAEIKSIFEDEKGWLWMASGYQGLVLTRNGITERYTVDDGLHDNSVYHFLKTSENKLYVIGDQGMSEIIIGVDQKISFKKFSFTPNTTTYAKFFSAIEAPDGTIWLGGEEGLAYLENDTLKRFLLNGKQLSVTYLLKDNLNTIWIATAGNGILQARFNSHHQLELVKSFAENDGLNSNSYLTLLADKENNIWAGSSKGISVIGQSGKFRNRILNFDESDGFLKAGFNYMQLFQASNGIVWVATDFGITSFNPYLLNFPEDPPKVYITGVRQAERNKPVVVEENKNYPAKNKFSYSQNSMTFNFTALDYANQENIRYYYKLDGLDSNWIHAGGLRSISFENLSPGNYSFRVKALNSKSIWSIQDAVYSFSIVPPFWKTWWFIVSILIIITGLSIVLARKRIEYVKKREAQKTALQKLRASNYQQQLEIEQIINHFASSMNKLSTIDDLLWDVVKNCISKLKFEDCVIYLLDEQRNVFIQKAAAGSKTAAQNKIVNPIEIIPGHGVVGSIALTGKPEIIADTASDSRHNANGIRGSSEIAVPILYDEKVIGVIDSEHTQRDFYTERHLQILTSIASLCAGKIKTIDAERKAREKELEILQLSKDVATSQLTALRTQMNPHFIFNALNSVQHFILQGNVIEANRYLSKFSKLQREILHCSSMPFITLEKEMEILNAYLQLEKFRFDNGFTYQVETTEDIEPEEIKIPPMILQPFIENAIWHGLMPRSADRNLSIFFNLHSDDVLLATIKDNGIGRAASAKLKTKNGQEAKAHESKGMSMVKDRLNLLQFQYDKPFEVTVSDIEDIHGVVQGTQVAVKIYIGNSKL